MRTNEGVGGKDAFVQLAVLLAATERMVFGTGIANLEQMGAPTQLPVPDVAYPRIIGANGPKMLALAGETTDGAMPATHPPEFTAQARQVLGPDELAERGAYPGRGAGPD